MECIINRDCFHKAIIDVSKAVSLKATIPILSGIKLTAMNNRLLLIGSNANIVIEKVIPLTIDGQKVLDVISPGSVVISAKYLANLIKKLPNDIHLKVNESQAVTIRSNEIMTTIKGFSSEEYPILPQIDKNRSIKISSAELIEMIKQTVFAVSKNESRPVLTGVNMSFGDNNLSCAATNSHRLAFRECEIKSTIKGSYIVPGTSLMELSSLINNEVGNIRIFLTDSHIVFKFNTFSLFSRLIQGKYPSISGLFPKDLKTTVTLDTDLLLKGIDRACLFASEWKNNNVHLEIKPVNKLKVSSSSTEIGKIEELQSIKEIIGEPNINIALDGNYLMDILKVIKGKHVKVSFSGSMRPIIIEASDNASCRYLISPVLT